MSLKEVLNYLMKNVGISATRALVVHNVLLIVKSHVYHSRFINFFLPYRYFTRRKINDYEQVVRDRWVEK